MAIKKGMTILRTTNRVRAREISSYIWGLHFIKPLRIDVAVYDDASSIDAFVSKERYSIKMNPNVELEDVKQFLLKKGYIVED